MFRIPLSVGRLRLPSKMASDIITSFFVGFIAPIPLCAIVGVFLSFKKVTRSALVEDDN